MKSFLLFLACTLLLTASTLAHDREFIDKDSCPPNKCIDCQMAGNNLKTQLSCKFCWGYYQKWRDTTNKTQLGSFCSNDPIKLDNCDIASPINDSVEQYKNSSQTERDFFANELQGRYEQIVRSHGAENLFA